MDVFLARFMRMLLVFASNNDDVGSPNDYRENTTAVLRDDGPRKVVHPVRVRSGKRPDAVAHEAAQLSEMDFTRQTRTETPPEAPVARERVYRPAVHARRFRHAASHGMVAGPPP